MAITPSGKTRVMVAQTYSNPLSEGFRSQSIDKPIDEPIDKPIDKTDGQSSSNLETEDALNEDVGGSGLAEGKEVGSANEIEAPQEKKKTLANYIFKKLENWGYPGRRLQEFKSKFVRESVSAEGVKDVQVEIPDKKYPGKDGITDTVENEDLKQISQEVSQIFGLNFSGAERSEGKWTIKFTSQKMTTDEDEMNHDNLDEVYGTPSAKGKKSPGRGKIAFTVQEIYDQKKDVLVNKLKNIHGA